MSKRKKIKFPAINPSRCSPNRDWHRIFVGRACLLSVVSACSVTQAQETAKLSNAIEEMIVTANKRDESISTVPLSISAVSGEALKQQGISSVADLSRMVPALSVTMATQGTDVYTIRGVGFYDTTLAAVPTVSVYVDEVPLPFSVMSASASLDPERVEVLMGPQGTLFGQNSTGGAINYIAAKPTSNFAASITGTLGNYDTHNLSGVISGPMSDTLGGRFSFRSENSTQGWQESVSRSDRLGDVDKQQARLLFDMDATDKLSLGLKLEAFTDKSDTMAPRYVGYVLQVPGRASYIPQLINAPFTTSSAENADWNPGQDFRRDNRFYQVALHASYALTDELTLTNIAAYSRYDHHQTHDGEGLSFTTFNLLIEGDIDSLSEELRLQGAIFDRGQFVVGVNYLRMSIHQHENSSLDVYSTSYALVPIGGPRFMYFENINDQDGDSYGIFGNVDYDLSDTVAVHSGLRYTDASTDLKGCTLGDTATGLLMGSTNPPYQCATRLATGRSGYVRDTLDEDNVSWRIGLDYKPAHDVLFYANISRGYKAGSFPVLPSSAYPQMLPATQEELTAYEIGFKTAVLHLPLRITGALFHYDYKDKQIRGRTTDPVFGLLERLINIPDSDVDGVEGNFLWQPLDGLRIASGFSYIKSEIHDFSNYAVNNTIVDLDGERYPNAPALQTNFSALYDWSIGNGLNMFIGSDYRYASSTRGTLGFTSEMDIPSYGLFGAQFGVRAADDQWRVALWGKNLNDENYLAGANRSGESYLQFAGMPRTYGVSLTYNIN